MARVILYLCRSLSQFVFVFLFGLSLYFLLFFKSQSILFLLIPTSSSDLSLFLNGIIGVVIFEVVYIFSEMVKQCAASVFFVDWEQSKGKIQTKANDSELSTISVWRSIFIVNEWSKLQTFRKCNVPITLIGVLFLLRGLGAQNLALLQPQFTDMNIAKKNLILLLRSVLPQCQKLNQLHQQQLQQEHPQQLALLA